MGKRKSNRRQHGEGSVYQRADGRWVSEIHLGYKSTGAPDRRYFYGKTAEESLAKKQKFASARDDGFTPQKGKGFTVSAWLHHWLYKIVKDQVRESTWHKSYRGKTEQHLIPNLSGYLKDLDEQQLDELYVKLRRDGLSPATITQIHAILSHALKVAVKRKLIPRNPCNFTRPPSGDKVESVPPERAEVSKALAAVRSRWNGARWGLALALGLRQGEALGLTWPMLDLDDVDNASVRVAWELVRLPVEHGCADPHACGTTSGRHRYPCPADCPKAARRAGRKHSCARACPRRCGVHEAGRCPTFCPDDCVKHATACPDRVGGLVLTEPKSAKSKRSAPIPRPLAEWLVEHRTWQEAQRVGNPVWAGWGHDGAVCDRRARAREVVCPKCRRPSKADSLVFAQQSGAPIDARRDWQEWADLLAELGVPHYRVHDGRHFAATTLLEEGADVVVAQELLGHASPAFTQAAYQHVRPKLARDAADKMGSVLWSE